MLEVGCGTGVLAAALAERTAARVWAVDAEPAMVEIARGRMPKGAGVREGRAEELPFRDGWFERVVMRLAVHLVDRERGAAGAPPRAGAGRPRARRHVRHVSLRRLLAEPAVPVARGDRPRTVPGAGAAVPRARGGRLRVDADRPALAADGDRPRHRARANPRPPHLDVRPPRRRRGRGRHRARRAGAAGDDRRAARMGGRGRGRPRSARRRRA